MSGVLIVYYSKYGFTKKYAEWISSELDGDIYSVKNFRQNILNNYGTIILGSSLYAGKIKGINIKVFYLQGGINYKGLSLKHKIMMGLLKKMTEIKGLDKLNEEDKEFIATYGKTLDFTNKNNVMEIITYCKENTK